VDTLSWGVFALGRAPDGRTKQVLAEFREQAVELVRATGTTAAEVARDLQINDRTWGIRVKADRAERGEPDRSGLLRRRPPNAPN